MSYIENLTGSVVNASVQESLALGAGDFKIRGFNLTTSGDYKVLSSGLAIIDGLRVVSTGNLQILGSSTLDKYVFLRINTYTQVIGGVTTRKANLSLVAQSSGTPINNDDLYEKITGTKDVLLAKVTSGGVVDQNIVNALTEYDTGNSPITMESGYAYLGSGVRKIGNVVYFNLNRFYKIDGTAIPNITVVGTLNAKFRPSATFYLPSISLNGSLTYFSISPDGKITIHQAGGASGIYVPTVSYSV